MQVLCQLAFQQEEGTMHHPQHAKAAQLESFQTKPHSAQNAAHAWREHIQERRVLLSAMPVQLGRILHTKEHLQTARAVHVQLGHMQMLQHQHCVQSAQLENTPLKLEQRRQKLASHAKLASILQ
jgi:hypothetical protein